MITVARITPLADASLTAVVTLGLFAALIVCIVPAVVEFGRWLEANEDRIHGFISRHLRRIGHGLGADNRRIEDWADEIAHRPDGPA